jgi:hypothetical protein
MDNKLKLIENLNTEEKLKKNFKNHTNPITKRLVSFTNKNLEEKFSIKDLLR